MRKIDLQFLIIVSIISLQSCRNHDGGALSDVRYIDSVTVLTDESVKATTLEFLNGKPGVFFAINKECNEIRLGKIGGYTLQRMKLPDSCFANHEFMSYAVVNSNSAILLFADLVIIIDSSGNKLYQRNINRNAPTHDSTSIYFYGPMGNFFPPFYEPRLNRLYLPRYRIDCDWWEPSWYNGSPLAYLDLKTDSFHPANVRYPEAFKNHYYGDLIEASQLLTDSFNDVYFWGSNLFQRYNRFTGSKVEYPLRLEGLKSEWVPYVGDPIDIQKKMDHLKRNPWLLGVHYHPKSRSYLAICSDGVPDVVNGKYTSFDDRALVINTYNESFKWISSYRFEGIKTGLLANIHEDTLYVYSGNTKVGNNTGLRFHRFLLH